MSTIDVPRCTSTGHHHAPECTPIDAEAVDKFLEGIKDIDLSKVEVEVDEKEDDKGGLTLYTRIGREGGASNGELDPTPISAIIKNPAQYGCDGTWRWLKNGCPHAHGRPHAKGKGVAFSVDAEGAFTLLCYDGGHNHAAGRQKQGADGRSYWVYRLTPELAGQRHKWPPFESGSDTEIARVLLGSVLVQAEYDTPTTVRVYDDKVGDVNALHRRGARRASPTAGKWVRWGSDQLKGTIRSLDGEWVRMGENKDGEPSFRRIEMSTPKVENIAKAIISILGERRTRASDGQGDDGSPVSKFMGPSPMPCIPLRGCIFDLTTGMFVAPDRWESRDYYVRAEHTLPVDSWDGAPMTPKWGNFLHDVWGHCDDFAQRVMFLQEWVGVALANETTKHNIHVLLKGVAGCGKSQIIDVVSQLFPQSTRISVDPTKLGRFDLSGFAHARINVVADMDSQAIADAAQMKALQSGDLIKLEAKYQPAFFARPTAAWLISCNSSWRPSERDDSVYRRWTVLSFDRAVPESKKVAGLAQLILQDEIQGIVAWAVEGYRRFRSQGCKYTPVPSSSHAIREWRTEIEPLRQWVDECAERCDLKAAPAVSKLYAHYQNWAKDNGYKAMSNKSFTQDLKKMGHEHKVFADSSRISLCLKKSVLIEDPVAASV